MRSAAQPATPAAVHKGSVEIAAWAWLLALDFLAVGKFEARFFATTEDV